MSSNLITTTWNREETQFHFTHRIPSPKLAQLSTKEAHLAHEFSHGRKRVEPGSHILGFQHIYLRKSGGAYHGQCSSKNMKEGTQLR